MSNDSTTGAKYEWYSVTTPCAKRVIRRGREFTEPFRRYGKAIAWIEWSSICTIVKIETLQGKKGAATRLLSALKAICDKHGLRIFGNATAYQLSAYEDSGGLLSQEELVTWYRHNGFGAKTREDTGMTEIWYPDIPVES